VHTTLDFAEFVLNHNAFVEGYFDTHFVSKYFTENSLQNEDSALETIAAAAVANILQEKKTHQSVVTNETTSRWKSNRS
jgi:acetyl/propionyl-CoA carboxylase alpha subunit